MKKILAIVLSVFLVFIFISSRNTPAEQKDELSLEYLNSLTGQECLSILEDNGLKIPDGYDDRKIVEVSVKHVIEFFYNNGITNAVPFNYTDLVELSDRIALIIKESNSLF